METNSIKILAIDTSCDETSAAVTLGNTIISNVIWSQASLHSKFGGIFPSLAKRAHEERIDWVVKQALKKAQVKFADINFVAVTYGPGLAVSLEVGIKKAKEISKKLNIPLIPVNHIEGHLLSPLAVPKSSKGARVFSKSNISFPALSLVVSGKHTDLYLVTSIGNYETLATTTDDALGEALDKSARMLGLGYPGGEILEKMAKQGDKDAYNLPTPMAGREQTRKFSYSGIKTAMFRLTEVEKPLNRGKIQNLAASFQDKAFKHVENMVLNVLQEHKVKSFLLGGGVSANIELRKRLRKVLNQKEISLHVPYSKKLCTDNAAMIGLTAYYHQDRVVDRKNMGGLDRNPRLKL